MDYRVKTATVYYNAGEFIKFVEDENSKPGNEERLYELIDGQIYMMSSPTSEHGLLVRFIFRVFDSYFINRNCEALFAPHDLFLYDKKRFALFTENMDECRNVFVPDLMVICDKRKIKKNGVHGAPDLVVEIVSPSSVRLDYITKMHNYMYFGVKEYWIVNPLTRKIMIFASFDNKELSVLNYTFDDVVKSEIFDSLSVDFKQFVNIE